MLSGKQGVEGNEADRRNRLHKFGENIRGLTGRSRRKAWNFV